MSDAVITVENLGKKYQIVHEKSGRGGATLRETLTNKASGLVRGLIPGGKGRQAGEANGQARREEFWALRNVSFEVKQGEVLGIIGRNGAGKSTLLKVLSRITEPTEGRVHLRGRVASLLEVGTGFHPELTGRENIFLNGAILGMGRDEIRKKFDEIVDFAGTERFLDTPVKRYSSGMYVRLAFAVAAHLEPEILIVDEVLSVGDGEFQKKCLGKMEDVSKGGRTIVFVSHNLTAVRALCESGMLLQNGQLIYMGPSNSVLERYMSSTVVTSGRWIKNPEYARPKEIWFESVSLQDGSGSVRAEFDFDEAVNVRISAIAARRFDNAQIAMRVTNREGIAVFTTCNTDEPRRYVPFEAGPVSYTVRFPSRFLMPGRYMLTIAAHIARVQLFDLIDDEISFVIHETKSYAGVLPDDRTGVVNGTISWRS